MQTYQKPGISLTPDAEIDVSRRPNSKKWVIAAVILLVVGGVGKFSQIHRGVTSEIDTTTTPIVEEHSDSSQVFNPVPVTSDTTTQYSSSNSSSSIEASHNSGNVDADDSTPPEDKDTEFAHEN
mmetsp:Transcript_3986/g.5917  ORF Transcript_3986/g.5917 Transcript_3986/m.5917 type:complete len:124 (+) Transcript_3986:68-439(+)